MMVTGFGQVKFNTLSKNQNQKKFDKNEKRNCNSFSIFNLSIIVVLNGFYHTHVFIDESGWLTEWYVISLHFVARSCDSNNTWKFSHNYPLLWSCYVIIYDMQSWEIMKSLCSCILKRNKKCSPYLYDHNDFDVNPTSIWKYIFKQRSKPPSIYS